MQAKAELLYLHKCDRHEHVSHNDEPHDHGRLHDDERHDDERHDDDVCWTSDSGA